MKNVIIIGGGLGGLLSSIQLARAGVPCTLIEKNNYPFHRVCGEYISREAIPFLQSLDIFPHHFHPPHIDTFQLSSTDGHHCTLPLDMGGFGISRYSFDYFLYQHAVAAGVRFLLNTSVTDVV